jgi:choline dehydrogenase-like flavoprotein
VRAYDAVVVGAGAAGGWAAKELCDGGLEVLLLEAGPALDPARDFPLPPPPARGLAARAAAARGQRVQLRCAVFDGRSRRFFVDDRHNPYTTPRGRPFNWFRGRQVGGRLPVWGRVMLRLRPEDLDGWPLDYEELAPCYEAVEQVMAVQPAALTDAEERFARVVGGGADVEPVGLAAPEPERVPRTLRAAAASGRLTLRPEAVVRKVTLEGSRATGVEYVDRRTRQFHSARASVVVLCASAFETVRILLGSQIPDPSGRLGRYVMDHVMTGIGGPLPDGDRPATPADPYDRGAATGFVSAHDGFGVQGGIGRGPSWYMLAHGRMAARAENRVTLDPSVRDAWDMPAAHVACSHSAADGAVAEKQLAAMHELAAAAGLEVRMPPSGRLLDTAAFRLASRRLLLPSGAFVPGSAAHEAGGAGMGDDPATSVTDPWGRLWEVNNVVVADAACFPSGMWQNVTLTIMALAVRACRRIMRDLRA